MNTDAIQRRLRHAGPQPKDHFIELQERDRKAFEAIHLHSGRLPTTYIYEFAKDLGRNYVAFQHRLTKLYNGTHEGVRYLDRDENQFDAYEAKYQPLIYDLLPAAEQELADHGQFHFVGHRGDPFVHRLMTACVSASIALAAKKQSTPFIYKHEILEHEKCPKSTREAKAPFLLPLPSTNVIPDEIFGLKYDTRHYFYALESDRNTESLERRNLEQTSFGKKMAAYNEVFERRLYSSHWGVPNLTVLIVTTNPVHEAKIAAQIQKVVKPEFHKRFLMKTKTDFGRHWHVPPVMHDLFTEPWRRADGKTQLISEG